MTVNRSVILLSVVLLFIIKSFFIYLHCHMTINNVIRCNVELWDSDEVMPRNTLLEKVKEKAGLLCMLTDKIDNELLDEAGLYFA